MAKAPNCFIIAGPNGAGKTTFALEYLPHYAHCGEFVNPDLIAQGLAPLDPARAMLSAGRLVLTRIEELSRKGNDFGFETTLSGRSYLALIKKLKRRGYHIHLFILWISKPALARYRITNRVKLGGHDVPEEARRRRWPRFIANLPAYQKLADSCMIFDNSGNSPVLMVELAEGAERVRNEECYDVFLRETKA
ncbi:MAG TPA: zeta toxin family protein [Kiritimatiellia bacterium]|nr:zeta toxin family protein [Kiritimatiellia bacterium]HMO98126.1 zeta toxin family protein [Kiritimatiellia bacterium]HMP96183.1 zeta toxin family protein [Kiritimatiellia bacterium]